RSVRAPSSETLPRKERADRHHDEWQAAREPNESQQNLTFLGFVARRQRGVVHDLKQQADATPFERRAERERRFALLDAVLAEFESRKRPQNPDGLDFPRRCLLSRTLDVALGYRNLGASIDERLPNGENLLLGLLDGARRLLAARRELVVD